MKSLEVLIFLGPPGSGKGTQAEILTEKLNLNHLSVGDLLRENIKKKTVLGKLAESYVSSGELVPDELIIDLMDSYITNIKNQRETSGIILDGFPRTINQATALENKIKQLDVNIKAVLNLDISDQKILNRLAGRGRDDDKPELIKNIIPITAHTESFNLSSVNSPSIAVLSIESFMTITIIKLKTLRIYTGS